jgi:predicted nucleic acid-binding protein
VKLLADTSALLALAMRSDRNHGAAVEFVRRNLHVRFVVTELIVSEVATRVRARAGAGPAAALARSLLASRRYELVFVDMALLRGAIERLARFSDKRLSLTDCASFELMDRLGLTSAFTFDRDFRDCGFSMAP